MNQANHAELMRNLINTIELSHKRQLNESSYLQAQLLLETDVQNNVIPAFRHLFESCNSLMEQGTEAGEYSDEEILALVKHYGSIKKIIDAHKNIPNAGETPGATSAVDAARRAIHTIVSRADGDDPVVANPKEFVADKNERLVSALVSADRKGKFKKLADLVKTWPSLAKNPKVANVLTVGTGVLIPLLSAGTWWAAPAAMMVVKTIFDRLQGKSWKQAVAANVSIGAIGSLIGLGAARASDLDQMVADFSQWAERPGDVPGYRSGDSSVIGSATAGEAGSDDPRGTGGPYFPGEAGSDDPRGTGGPYFPGEAGSDAGSGTGRRSFPGEVGYDEPDRTGTGIPPGEAGDYAADRTGTGIPPGEAGSDVPVVEPDSRPMRVRPVDPNDPEIGYRPDSQDADDDSTDWETENAPLSGDMETTAVADRSYLGRVRQLLGKDIPSMGGSSFGDAFKQAREDMGGPGNIFTWKGNLYTTNLASEGLYSGFDSKLVNFLRGIK